MVKCIEMASCAGDSSMDEKLWLTVFLEDGGAKWPPDVKGCRIAIDAGDTLGGCGYPHAFRTSPIFPLSENPVDVKLKGCMIYFYCFQPAFSAIGRLRDKGSKELVGRVFYSIGLASVLLVTEKEEFHNELLKVVACEPNSFEAWKIEDGRVVDIRCYIKGDGHYETSVMSVHDYRRLPLTAKAIVDEFVANIAVIAPKIALHVPAELEVFVRLVKQVNELVDELVYLNCLEGAAPETLGEYSEEMLKEDAFLRETINGQNLDRIIQINAVLSYVSTQAVSGAVPIFERRSLIRRNSLLGIGTAVIALNNIIHSIEYAFSRYSIEDIVGDRMAEAEPLEGLTGLPDYDWSSWGGSSVNRWGEKAKPREWYPKLPYYSGRLGYREAEHTISVAIQALTGGATLEWSLLTVTHEILHGHVRRLLALIFQGQKDRCPPEKWRAFYERFEAHLEGRPVFPRAGQLDSMRNIILAYCCDTVKHGSLTKIAARGGGGNQKQAGERRYAFKLPDQEALWRLFGVEYRNINEIWVHVLDLHYFYGSNLSAYIPLIWRSWAEVPHVKSDLRHYILRSILVIAAKTKGTRYQRFHDAVARLSELLGSHLPGKKDGQLTEMVINYLKDADAVEDLFYPFSASLILVDLVNNVLVSTGIRGALLDDNCVGWKEKEEGFEEEFEYRLPEGFVDEVVKRPAAYLLDRAIRRLQAEVQPARESETAKLFLACSSCLSGA